MVFNNRFILRNIQADFGDADLIIDKQPEVEDRIQQIRINGIVQRANGLDSRFQCFDSTQKFLCDLEINEGDQPLTLSEDLEILKDAGFINVALYWKEYREVVYGGQKES